MLSHWQWHDQWKHIVNKNCLFIGNHPQQSSQLVCSQSRSRNIIIHKFDTQLPEGNLNRQSLHCQLGREPKHLKHSCDMLLPTSKEFLVGTRLLTWFTCKRHSISTWLLHEWLMHATFFLCEIWHAFCAVHHHFLWQSMFAFHFRLGHSVVEINKLSFRHFFFELVLPACWAQTKRSQTIFHVQFNICCFRVALLVDHSCSSHRVQNRWTKQRHVQIFLISGRTAQKVLILAWTSFWKSQIKLLWFLLSQHSFRFRFGLLVFFMINCFLFCMCLDLFNCFNLWNSCSLWSCRWRQLFPLTTHFIEPCGISWVDCLTFPLSVLLQISCHIDVHNFVWLVCKRKQSVSSNKMIAANLCSTPCCLCRLQCSFYVALLLTRNHCHQRTLENEHIKKHDKTWKSMVFCRSGKLPPKWFSRTVFFACGLCRNNTAAYTNTTWGWHSNGHPVRVDLTMDLLQKWDFSGCALSAPIAVGQPLGQPWPGSCKTFSNNALQTIPTKLYKSVTLCSSAHGKKCMTKNVLKMFKRTIHTLWSVW